MRPGLIGLPLAILLAACGTGTSSSPIGAGIDARIAPPGDSGDPDGGSLPAPVRGFQIKSPEIMIPHGTEITYCYYFKTPNTEALPIKSWQSHMSAGSHHMILYTTASEQKPAGTLSTDECGGAGLDAGVWTYSSQTVDQTFHMPADDGTGLPLAQNMPPGQPAYVQMHYLNATDDDIKVHIELNANAYDPGVAVRGAAPYVTYNANISIPAAPGSTASASGSCPVSPSLKFFTLSTHDHKQGIHTAVKDDTTMVFQSTDWEHPGQQDWGASPFFSFASGKLSYQCDYLNAAGTRAPIVDGPSAATNEMCMAIGYFFDPSSTVTSSKLCLNSFVIPQ